MGYISKLELRSFDKRHCVAVMKRLCAIDKITKGNRLFSIRSLGFYNRMGDKKTYVRTAYFDLKDRIFLWLKPLIRDCVLSTRDFRDMYPDIVQDFYIEYYYDFQLLLRLQKCTIGHMIEPYDTWEIVRDAFAGILTTALRNVYDRIHVKERWQHQIKDIVIDESQPKTYPSPEAAIIIEENQRDFAEYILSIPKHCPYDPLKVFVYTLGMFTSIKRTLLNRNEYSDPGEDYIRYTLRRKALQSGYALDDLLDRSKLNGLFKHIENEVYKRCKTQTLMVQT